MEEAARVAQTFCRNPARYPVKCLWLGPPNFLPSGGFRFPHFSLLSLLFLPHLAASKIPPVSGGIPFSSSISISLYTRQKLEISCKGHPLAGVGEKIGSGGRGAGVDDSSRGRVTGAVCPAGNASRGCRGLQRIQINIETD